MSNHLQEIDLREEFVGSSYLFEWNHWFRCTVRILVVTDASGSFDSTQSFGLGKVLDVIKADLWPHVVFNFTTAHRGSSAADITNFKFDAEDLSKYHQIWFFGVARGGTVLTQAELRAVAEFMDNGGGVFATGDHEDLGVDLCAEVPRVRSMRRWYHPNPGPNGEPVAPDQTGAGRLDTLTDDPGTAVVEASQTDKVPQVIRPKFYSKYYSGWFGNVAYFPHPVLCGPSGPITHLPDHMHEGLIEVPANLGDSFSFAGYNSVEYPSAAGFQQRPEVIAHATNFVTGSEFGVLGAYDGHKAGVGRVVVDATWHHWFNINMKPYQDASTPGHSTYDAAVVPKWDEIKAYFRNVAAWLSPPNVQNCLRNGGWLYVVRYYDIIITLRELERVPDHLTYYWQLGTFARDALGRIAGQCQTLGWLFERFVLEEMLVLRDPWDQRPPRPEPDPAPFIAFEDLSDVALGGAVHALAEAAGDGDADTIKRLLENEELVTEIAMEGGRQALDVLAERYRESCDWLYRRQGDKGEG